MSPVAKQIIEVRARLEPIMPGYLDLTRADVTRLTSGLAEEAYVDIALIGHGLKGSGKGYELDKISELGEQIEKAAEGENRSEIERLIGELSHFLENIDIFYI